MVFLKQKYKSYLSFPMGCFNGDSVVGSTFMNVSLKKHWDNFVPLFQRNYRLCPAESILFCFIHSFLTVQCNALV